jgi:hypothetical protein
MGIDYRGSRPTSVHALAECAASEATPCHAADRMHGLGGDALSLGASFLLAGGLASWIAVPARLGGWDRLFLSLALAVPATVLAAAPGLATHSLAAWNLALGLGALAVAAGWRVRTHVGHGLTAIRSRRMRPPRAPRPLPVLMVGVALALAWFGVLVPEGAEDTGDGRPNGTIVYYHWGIVSEVVAAGGLPETLTEWGKPREFPYEYGFSVMHGAATATLAGESGFVLEERYRIAMVIAALLAAFALWRRWLPPWWAWLAAVLTLNVSRIETRMLVYKPEAFAFVLVLWSAWLLDEALERRSRLWGGMAGLVLASSFLAHPIGSLLVAPLWGGILAGRLLPGTWRAVRERQARTWGESARRVASTAGLRALPAALVVFALLFGGLRSTIGSTGQDLAQSPQSGVDLTRVVYNLAYVTADPLAEPRVPECGDLFGVYATVRPFYSTNATWFFFDPGDPASALLIAGIAIALAGGLLLLLRRSGRTSWPDRAKRGAVTWAFYGLGVYLLAMLVCAYYSTWVPERVGPMRLMPYWALIFPPLLAAAAWGVARVLSGRRLGGDLLTFRARSRWLGGGVGVLPALALATLATWTFSTASARDRGVPPFYIAEPRVGGLAEEGRRAYIWTRHNLPKDATILTNGYVEGALGMLSGRSGLLDGRAPFAQPDPWRKEAIDLLRRSRAFFRRPAETPVPAAATHLLVAPHEVNLGGSFFPTDFAALARDPRLREVRRFPRVVVYRVRRPAAGEAHRSFGQRPWSPPGDDITVRASVANGQIDGLAGRAAAVAGASGFQRSCS